MVHVAINDAGQMAEAGPIVRNMPEAMRIVRFTEKPMSNDMTEKQTADNEPSGMGMVGGAAAGAAAGSLMGPLGAAVGAVVGGAIGSQTHAEDIKKAARKVKSIATSRPAKKALKTVGRKIKAVPAKVKSMVSKAKENKKASKTKSTKAKGKTKVKPAKRAKAKRKR